MVKRIELIYLSKTGRYVGNEIPISVVVFGLSGVESGDALKIELKRGNTVIHEHTTVLDENDRGYFYVIPANVFVGLGTGVYDIVATYANEASKTAQYTVASKPTIEFNCMNPNSIELPIIAPKLPVSANWVANGLMMSSISGNSEIVGTGISASVVRTGQRGE